MTFISLYNNIIKHTLNRGCLLVSPHVFRHYCITLWCPHRVGVQYEQFLQKYKAQKHAVFSKRYLIYQRYKIVQGMQICSFVFSLESLHVRYPHPTCVKISTLYHNFFIDYCKDFSILCICTKPLVDSFVRLSGLDF